MANQFLTILLIAVMLSACSVAPPKVAVAPASIDDEEKYRRIYEECLATAQTADLADKKALDVAAGAVLGVEAAATIASSASLMVPAIPFMMAGALVGGSVFNDATSKEERQAREGGLARLPCEQGV